MTSILQQDIQYLPGVGPNRRKMLSEELDIHTFGDLLQYYPYKHVDRSRLYSIGELNGDMPFVQVKGHILSFETFKMSARKERVVAHFTDGSGKVMDLTWFNGGKYAKQSYAIGKEYIVFGRPNVYNGRINVTHPDIDAADKLELSAMGMQPYYNTTEKMKKMGLNSRSVERLTKALLDVLKEPLPETLPDFITQKLHLMSRDEALRKIHYPQNAKELEQARVRLKFEELFYVQLNILRYASDQRRKYRGYVFSQVGNCFNDFFHNHLPFSLTEAQKRVIREIRKDMGSGRQMNRLLQGDVGSGKTLVALMSMLIALDNGYQACIMAPTEILAEQHLKTIMDFLQGMDIRVALLTGIVKGKRRQEILDGLLDGTVQILVGTHAVIEDTVQFARLGFVVVDEQHRFGVAQRAKLWNKSTNPPHVLVMTATPIPRTLAMTLYGDLDVSVIDELPPGRKPIVTQHVYDRSLPSLYDGIRQQVHQGRQVYIVFPLIEESEKIDLKTHRGKRENRPQEPRRWFRSVKTSFPRISLKQGSRQDETCRKRSRDATLCQGRNTDPRGHHSHRGWRQCTQRFCDGYSRSPAIRTRPAPSAPRTRRTWCRSVVLHPCHLFRTVCRYAKAYRYYVRNQ